MEYEDLVIQLRIGAGGGYTVQVARSPAGETEAEPLSVPMSGEEIDRLAAAFGRPARDLRRRQETEVSVSSLAELGDRLFHSLLPEEVRNRYHESLGRIANRGDRGLRLRVQMGLTTPAMAQLHAIPWEFLHSGPDGHFLALSRQTSIVRYLDLGLPSDGTPASPPLSILALAAEDSSLDLSQERLAIEQAWNGQGEVRLEFLSPVTLESLREELLARTYHVLHFMGHGGFASEAGEGSLAFRGKDGQRVSVSGPQLAEQMRNVTSLRLVVLNACWTARASSSGLYTGVATALLNAGVPAVLAMQFPISDAAALAFSRVFYRRLARGDTIDAAVTEGRMAIRREDRASLEWGTPVLFERLTSGRIVEPLYRTPRRMLTAWSRLAESLGAALIGSEMIAAFRVWIARYWRSLIAGILACSIGTVQILLYLHQARESSLKIRELEARLKDQSGIEARSVRSNGIEIRSTFLGFSYKDLILDSRELIVVLNDGRSWIDTYRELLMERLATKGKITRFCFLNPSSQYIDILVRKNGKKKQTEIDEIQRSLYVLSEVSPRWADLEVRVHMRPSPYCLFLTEDLAIVDPYFFFEAGSLPMFTFRRGTELYDAYREDARRLLKEASPVMLKTLEDEPARTQ